MALTSVAACLAAFLIVGVAMRPDGEKVVGDSVKYLSSASSFISDYDDDDKRFPAQIITCSKGDGVIETTCGTLDSFRKVTGQVCSVDPDDDGADQWFDAVKFTFEHVVGTCRMECEHSHKCVGITISEQSEAAADADWIVCKLHNQAITVEDPSEEVAGGNVSSLDLGPADDGGACFIRENTYDRIVRIVTQKYTGLEHACNTTHCEKGDFAGCVLRFAGHDLMDWDPQAKEGGSDACINFDDMDNKGLMECLSGEGEFGKGATIQHAYDEVCHEVSLADFIVVAAEALMMVTRPDWDESTMRSPSLDHSKNFKFGRTTKSSCAPGPLPNPDHSCQAVEDNFINQLGLTWTGAAALMGVHTLGRAAKQNSGFDGFWVSGDDAKTFDNKYFVNLLGAGWFPCQVPSEGDASEDGGGKWQWCRSDNGASNEMMLNTDMCLMWKTDSGCKAEEDKDCCLWASVFGLGGAESQCMVDEQGTGDWHKCYASMADIGGTFSRPDGCSFNVCCAEEKMKTCGNDHMNPVGAPPAGVESSDAVKKYADPHSGDLNWIADFVEVWETVTTLNTKEPKNLFSISNCPLQGAH